MSLMTAVHWIYNNLDKKSVTKSYASYHESFFSCPFLSTQATTSQPFLTHIPRAALIWAPLLCVFVSPLFQQHNYPSH